MSDPSAERQSVPAYTDQSREQYGYKPGPITKTRLYNFDPLKPHFYIVKLEFTGV